MPKHNEITQANRFSTAGAPSGLEGWLRATRPIEFWPRGLAGRPYAVLGLVAFCLPLLAGCGGATAPCPTPTSEIDRLRQESTRIQAELDQAVVEERRLRSERDQAATKLGAAQAALDSLLAGSDR